VAAPLIDDEHVRPQLEPPSVVSRLLKPTEVARRLGVSRTWLYAAAKDGRIPSIRIGGPEGPLRVVPADLDAWIDEARDAWRPGDTSAATLRRLADAA
jgi:excisionase family DNA binding protein